MRVARDYYNSTDADEFYWKIWGGADIHVGLYDRPNECIHEASRRTIAHMASRLETLRPGARVVDFGSGFCGPARYLASIHGCRVTAINFSEVENARSRELNEVEGLDEQIDVVEANFEELPFEDASFQIAWSQDALLHSGRRELAFREAARLLSADGEFVFTDPMQADNCPSDVLQPILDRLHLESLGSPSAYRRYAAKLGLELVEFEDLTQNLVRHYARVWEETERRRDELLETVSEEYLTRMIRGLERWVKAGERSHLTWGIFHFRKAAR